MERQNNRQTDRMGDGRKKERKKERRKNSVSRPFGPSVRSLLRSFLPCLVNTHYEVGGRADNSHALSPSPSLFLCLFFPHFGGEFSEKGKGKKAENVFSLSFVSCTTFPARQTDGRSRNERGRQGGRQRWAAPPRHSRMEWK